MEDDTSKKKQGSGFAADTSLHGFEHTEAAAQNRLDKKRKRVDTLVGTAEIVDRSSDNSTDKSLMSGTEEMTDMRTQTGSLPPARALK